MLLCTIFSSCSPFTYGLAVGLISGLMQMESGQNAPPASRYSSPAPQYDYLLDPGYAAAQVMQQQQANDQLFNSMINTAARQVEEQNWQEYQEAKRFRPNLTYEQFMQEKAAAYAEVKRQETGSSTSSGNTSFGSPSNTSSYGSSHTLKDCAHCSVPGNGKCGICDGKGWVFGFTDSSRHQCTSCGGSGLCKFCHGTGKR